MENIKEKLTKAIEIIVQEGISREPGAARFMAERIVMLLADFVKAVQPGPTGNFPDGKTDPNDEGEIRLLVSTRENKVRVYFGKAVAWFEMPKPEALTFAFAVLEQCGVKIEHKIQQDPAPGAPA